MDEPSTTLQALAGRIRNDLRVGNVRLPTLPAVASRVCQALAGDQCSAADVARIVQLDPPLTARLLQVANSARYLGTHPVGNVRDAIARLGMGTTRNLALALSLNSKFTTEDIRLRRHLQAIWMESCRVAAIAQVLAAITPGLQPDKAILAGLVHNVGILSLLPYLAEHPQLLDDLEATERLLGRLRAQLGTVLLRHWHFDTELVPIPEQADNWQRDTGEAIDYVDLVLVARVHALFGRKPALFESLDQMPAYRKFPISRFGADASVQLIEEAQGEIGTLMNLLRGT